MSLPAVKTSRFNPEAKITPRTACNHISHSQIVTCLLPQLTDKHPKLSITVCKQKIVEKYITGLPNMTGLLIIEDGMYLIVFQGLQGCHELLPHGQVHEIDWLALQPHNGIAPRT
jgi:hypothetical protein